MTSRQITEDKKYKILIIDDDTFLSDMYSFKFSQNNFETAVFNDANGDFVEKVFKVKPDIISLDIIMPGRDGFEALEMLKEDKRTKDIPVVILSNKSQESDIEQGLKLGVEDYMVCAYFTPSEVVQSYTELLLNSANYIKRYPACVDIQNSDIYKEGTSDEERNQIIKDILKEHGIVFSEDNTQKSKELYNKVMTDISYLYMISPAYIQRIYKVNYDVAAKVMDELEEGGWIEAPNGAKPRKIIKRKT
jgi:DNA-binding response OmpR family regulator